MINNLFGNTEIKKKIMLVDFSAISHSTFHVCRQDSSIDTEEDLLNMWRHTLLTSLLTRKSKVNPDIFVLCLDVGTWRTDFFKYYKARRKADKANSDVDYQFFYDASNKFIEEIKEYFPWMIISKRNCEGDDILAILAHVLSKDNDVVVCSSDKDIKQLLKLKNVSYYSYRNDQFETLDNPHEFLLRQILGGDKDDDIPNVKSQDNSFVSSIRQKQCGPQGIDKILEQGIEEFLNETNLHANYERNKKMIELSEQTIPEDLWRSVVEKYNSYEHVEPDFIKILQFLNKNKLKKLQERINEFF